MAGLFLVILAHVLDFLFPYTPRPRFEGSCHGGDNGVLEPYDQLTEAQHEEIGGFGAGGLQ